MGRAVLQPVSAGGLAPTGRMYELGAKLKVRLVGLFIV